MSKFHINPETGNPGNCTAKTKCPYGDLEADHYPTPEIARAAYEVKMKTQELEALQKDYYVENPGAETTPLSARRLESMKRGWLNTKTVSFRESYVGGSGEQQWYGKLTGEPTDVDLLVTFTKRGVISSLAWEGKSLLVDSINIENAKDLSDSDKGKLLLKMSKKATTKFADKLSEDRKEVLERAQDFNRGIVRLNNTPMTYVENIPNAYGETREGSYWKGEKTPGGWTPEVYVHEGDANVTIRDSSKGLVKVIHSVKLRDGYNSFMNGTEAARFLIAADSKVQKFQGF